MKNVLAFSGSLRKDSYNTRVVHALAKLCAKHGRANMQLADIGTFPLFNQDLEAKKPEMVWEMKRAVESADAIIFATPEYNRSVPGVLKNAIDWLSRPYGDNSFAGKPVLVLGVTLGSLGTAVAQSHLKEILLYLDMQVVGQPELYIGKAHERIDESGMLTEDTQQLLLEGIDTLLARTPKREIIPTL